MSSSESLVWLREGCGTVKVLMYVEDTSLRLLYASKLGAHNTNALSKFPDAGFDLFVPEEHHFQKGTLSNKLNFISQDWRGIENNRIKRLKKLDIAILSWTITSKEIEKSLKGLVDNITFERYEPDLKD